MKCGQVGHKAAECTNLPMKTVNEIEGGANKAGIHAVEMRDVWVISQVETFEKIGFQKKKLLQVIHSLTQDDDTPGQADKDQDIFMQDWRNMSTEQKEENTSSFESIPHRQRNRRTNQPPHYKFPLS